MLADICTRRPTNGFCPLGDADQLKSGCIYTATAGKHSPLLGVMADSVPIYGSLGEKLRRLHSVFS